MNKYISLDKITGGKMAGDIHVTAEGWETRYSWGHTATVTNTYGDVLASAKYRYYNRTWEAYRFQSVLHAALYNYVRDVTGVDCYKPVCKRDQNPMKDKGAEMRRLARLSAREFARSLYDNLCAIIDGKATEEQIAAKFAARAVA